MEHTSEWDDIRGWQAKREGLRRQWEAELRRKEQVVQALPPPFTSRFFRKGEG
jgi:hypothetical protein